jgi:hypothetical protein
VISILIIIIIIIIIFLGEREHLEDSGIDGRIILRWNFRKWDVGGMDSIELAQDRDSWRAPANAVMNLRVP